MEHPGCNKLLYQVCVPSGLVRTVFLAWHGSITYLNAAITVDGLPYVWTNDSSSYIVYRRKYVQADLEDQAKLIM